MSDQSAWARGWRLFLATVVTLGIITTGVSVMAPQTAYAQPAEDAEPVEPEAAPEDATEETEDVESADTSRSFLGWLIEASGVFGLILLILS